MVYVLLSGGDIMYCNIIIHIINIVEKVEVFCKTSLQLNGWDWRAFA